MEDNNILDHHNESPDEKVNKESLEIKNIQSESKLNNNYEHNKNKDSKIHITNEGNNKMPEGSNEIDLNLKLNTNTIKKNNNEIIKEKATDDNKLTFVEKIQEKSTNKSTQNINNDNKDVETGKNLEDNKKLEFITNLNANTLDKRNNEVIEEK